MCLINTPQQNSRHWPYKSQCHLLVIERTTGGNQKWSWSSARDANQNGANDRCRRQQSQPSRTGHQCHPDSAYKQPQSTSRQNR